MRWAASVLATVALVGQVTSFAHLVLVRHVRCAEHGELVELGKVNAAAPAATSRQRSSTIAADGSDDGHGHDHCLIAPMRRDRAALGTPASFDSVHVDAYGTIGVAVASEIPPPIALIILAPKNSPPVA
jgi:hypothetical protein